MNARGLLVVCFSNKKMFEKKKQYEKHDQTGCSLETCFACHISCQWDLEPKVTGANEEHRRERPANPAPFLLAEAVKTSPALALHANQISSQKDTLQRTPEQPNPIFGNFENLAGPSHHFALTHAL